jgi:hypothetical protein
VEEKAYWDKLLRRFNTYLARMINHDIVSKFKVPELAKIIQS